MRLEGPVEFMAAASHREGPSARWQAGILRFGFPHHCSKGEAHDHNAHVPFRADPGVRLQGWPDVTVEVSDVFAHGMRLREDVGPPSDMPPEPTEHGIVVHLDRLLEQREMTLTELSERVGVTVVNLSILKNGRARAVRFSTLSALCEALDCQPGDLRDYPARS
jgi:putative transcriptional regulator